MKKTFKKSMKKNKNFKRTKKLSKIKGGSSSTKKLKIPGKQLFNYCYQSRLMGFASGVIHSKIGNKNIIKGDIKKFYLNLFTEIDSLYLNEKKKKKKNTCIESFNQGFNKGQKVNRDIGLENPMYEGIQGIQGNLRGRTKYDYYENLYEEPVKQLYTGKSDTDPYPYYSVIPENINYDLLNTDISVSGSSQNLIENPIYNSGNNFETEESLPSKSSIVPNPEIIKLQGANEELATENEKLKEEKQELETENEKLQEEKQELATEKQELETENEKLKEEKQELATKNEELKNRIKILGNKNTSIQKNSYKGKSICKQPIDKIIEKIEKKQIDMPKFCLEDLMGEINKLLTEN